MSSPVAPVFDLRDGYATESYWPDEYLDGALPLLADLGWLTRALDANDRAMVTQVLNGLYEMGLDESDTSPFGLLWALRSTRAIGDVPGLDAQLADWRRWEETDHVGEPLAFLPALPDGDTGE